MEIIANNPVSSIVSIALYILAFLTVAQLLIRSNHKFPEKLQWMGRMLEIPFIGPVMYWAYHFSNRRIARKDKGPIK